MIAEKSIIMMDTWILNDLQKQDKIRGAGGNLRHFKSVWTLYAFTLSKKLYKYGNYVSFYFKCSSMLSALPPPAKSSP